MDLLKECLKQDTTFREYIIFDPHGSTILTKNNSLSSSEMTENAFRTGITVFNRFFDLLRYHPPLMFGRHGTPFRGEGICFIQGKLFDESCVFIIAIYALPMIAAKAIPIAIKLFETHIGTVEASRPFDGAPELPLPDPNMINSQYENFFIPPPGHLAPQL